MARNYVPREGNYTRTQREQREKLVGFIIFIVVIIGLLLWGSEVYAQEDCNLPVFFYQGENYADLYIQSPGGSTITVQEGAELAPSFPDWSPDGSQIVFVTWTQSALAIAQISVVNADGTNQKVLGEIRGVSTRALDWSQDGSQIGFIVEPFDGEFVSDIQIYTVTTGGEITNLTNLPNSINAEFDWSQDGSQIVYMSNSTELGNTEGDFEIWIMDENGNNKRRLTDNTITDVYPYFVDSTTIAYEVSDTHNQRLVTIDLEGNVLSDVQAPIQENTGVPSPDGEYVLIQTLNTQNDPRVIVTKNGLVCQTIENAVNAQWQPVPVSNN